MRLNRKGEGRSAAQGQGQAQHTGSTVSPAPFPYIATPFSKPYSDYRQEFNSPESNKTHRDWKPSSQHGGFSY